MEVMLLSISSQVSKTERDLSNKRRTENLFVASSYSAIQAAVAALPLKEAELQLNKIVIGIDGVIDDDVDKIEDYEINMVVVRTEDGESQSFDEVVMTAPLGWLKRNIEIFTPPIPDNLETAIKGIGYGNLEKVYIRFPTAFWDGPSSSDIDPKDRHTMVHWSSPTYASISNPEYWQQECFSLAALPSPHNQPILLFYLFGPNSQYLTSELARRDHVTQKDFLAEFFRPYIRLLPNYKDGGQECEPEAFLPTMWSQDALAGFGSYCNFQTGATQADKDIETMRHGIPERGVWLAGEHTAPFVALGTVTGAYWSGEGVAQRIVESYGMERVDESTFGNESTKGPGEMGA
jgi:Flavin containing amine oxidoreductase